MPVGAHVKLAITLMLPVLIGALKRAIVKPDAGLNIIIAGKHDFANRFIKRQHKASAHCKLMLRRADIRGINVPPDIARRVDCGPWVAGIFRRSEEHTSELQSLMRISYAVFCLKKKRHTKD